nr:hypothetical protein [uncultured Kingella sp.]
MGNTIGSLKMGMRFSGCCVIVALKSSKGSLKNVLARFRLPNIIQGTHD